MSQKLSLPDIKLRFCRNYSKKELLDYADYLKHKSQLDNGEISCYLSYESCEERDSNSLAEDILEKQRKESYKNHRLFMASEQFICLGRSFPFTVYWSNGRPSTKSSLEMFENEQMLKRIREKNWMSFGTSTLSADIAEFDNSYNLFMRLQEERSPERTERIKLLMKDPYFAAIIEVYEENEKPQILTNYKEADFKDTGCASTFIENKYGLDPTAAFNLATRFKKILFP